MEAKDGQLTGDRRQRPHDGSRGSVSSDDGGAAPGRRSHDGRNDAADSPAPADLHLHSTCSDGLLSPAAVVDAAADFGLGVIALTDHDTTEGVKVAQARGHELGVEVLAGVEISCTDRRGSELHLLGLGVDPDDASLAEMLTRSRRSRRERVDRMVDALGRAGVRITPESVLAGVRGSVGRPHVADALIRAGYCRDRQEAFDRWLRDGGVAAVPKELPSCEDAIRLVHAAGGVASLAHPGRRRDGESVADLAGVGLDGLEVIHPSHPPPQVEFLRAAAERLGLLPTGGSDNHGDATGMEVMRACRVPGRLAAAVKDRIARRAMAADARPKVPA